MQTLYAIGHSTHPIEKFIEILKAHGITLLADIRTVPKSGHNPQFNETALKAKLNEAGIRYLHMKALGGLRKPKKDSINTVWKNSGFRGYADYMQTDEFEKALNELIALSEKEAAAFMCAEGNPYRCHRLLVSDALTARGIPVRHISSRQPGRQHEITKFASQKMGRLSYPSSGNPPPDL